MARRKPTSAAPTARAAVYARYSTDKQDRKTSIGAQLANCRALAKREGFVIADEHVFTDEALSGAKIDRPGYAALREAIRRREIDVVLANETSRLTRVTSELIALGELLQQQRPQMHLVTCDGIDTRADGWEWLLLIKAGVDSQERRKIAFRVRGALRQRHEAGNSAGGRAYGYTHEDNGDYRRKVIVPAEASVVRRVFEMYADGMSHRAIAVTLNDERVPSPGASWRRRDDGPSSKRRDGKWMGSTVYSMLRNSLYRGEVIWNRREFRMYTDPDTGRTTRCAYRLPPEQWLRRTDESLRIVSAELWRRCERRMKATAERNARQKYRGGRRDAQYKRLFDLVCDECGGRYVMVSGRELGCSTHRSGGRSACSNDRRIKLAVANRVLLAMLCDPKDGLLSDEVIREVRRHAARYVRQAKRSAAARAGAASQLRKQIADLDTRSPALWTR